jgi:diguanylate cyclase (GGDEF)-like protein
VIVPVEPRPTPDDTPLEPDALEPGRWAIGQRVGDRRGSPAWPRPDEAIAALHAGIGHRPGPPARLDGALLDDVDALTGLHDRTAFERELRHTWVLANRYAADAMLVVVGVHTLRGGARKPATDATLRVFTDALRVAARRTDVIARIEDDEFAVILVDCDEAGAGYFESRLREALTEPAWPILAEIDLSLGEASLGDADSAALVLLRAEMTMLAQGPAA